MVNLNKIARILTVCASLFLIQCSSSVVETSNTDLNPFFGTFKGTSSNVVEGEMSERDLSVTIKPKKDGEFTIEWTAVRFQADGEEPKEMKTSIDFFHSPRPGIYTSAMKKDVFDNMVSYDPTRDDAEPFVWASLQDETLTLRALYILATGEYEMHTYKRTLEPGGLALEFERTLNRELITQVSAMLERDE